MQAEPIPPTLPTIQRTAHMRTARVHRSDGGRCSGCALIARRVKSKSAAEGANRAVASLWRGEARRIASVLEQAWDGEWYRCGYYDSGTPLCSAQVEEKVGHVARDRERQRMSFAINTCPLAECDLADHQGVHM